MGGKMLKRDLVYGTAAIIYNNCSQKQLGTTVKKLYKINAYTLLRTYVLLSNESFLV